MKPRKIYWIKWVDAAGSEGWNDAAAHIEALSKKAVCQSIGFVLHEDEAGIIICESMGYESLIVDFVLFIPRGMILKKEMVGHSE